MIATLTVADSRVAMSGWLPPGALPNRRPWITTPGVGRMDSEMSPSMARSRPVASLAFAAISAL